MPSTTIFPEKIKDKSYLLFKVQQKHKRLKVPKTALLIGAGCSYPILPLGGGLIKTCQQLCYIRRINPALAAGITEEFLNSADVAKLDEQVKKLESNKTAGITFADFVEEEKKKLAAILELNKEVELEKVKIMMPDAKWEEYREAILSDTAYGYWMDGYSQSPKERQIFIEAFIENKNPGGAYIVLAYLIERGLFSNILTSNFDDFINDTLIDYTGTKSRFYADDELSQYISLYSDKPNIIKLHGDYRYANIKNTVGETKKLSKRLEDKLRELLTELDFIVIGYNGADYSIMSVLHQVKSPDCELLWCGLNENDVHWRVAHLINNTENSHFIKIKGFDELMGDFYLEFMKTPPDNLVEKARQRQEEIGNYVKQFNLELRQRAETSEEVERLEKTDKIWELWNEAVNKKDLKKQLELAAIMIEQAGPEEKSAAPIYRLRGTTYRKLKEYNKAVEDYTKAIDLSPEYREAYISRGYTFGRIKDYQKAIADDTKAIELKKGNGHTYRHRGQCYYSLGQFSAALADANTSIALNSQYKRAYELRSDIYRLLGQYDRAEADSQFAKKLVEKGKEG